MKLYKYPEKETLKLKPLKEMFYPQKQTGYFAEKEARQFRVADYTKWLLIRIFIAAIFLVIILIPVVKYLMLIFEGREVTTGQAIIFIVQSLTTTGYGELLPFHSFPMIALTILLMVSGVFLIFMFAGTLMASLVESRMIPRAPTFTRQESHVIFTAFNEAVARTIDLLERHDVPYVVAVEDQPQAVDLMRRGINVVCADPKYDEGLNRLNVKNARLVVATSADTDNINITLGIKNINDTPVLAMMENEKRAELAYAAGARQVVTLEETLGKQLVDWITADASPTRFLELLNVEVSPEIIAQLKPSIIHVGANSEFCGKTIGDTRLRSKTGATIAAVWNEDGTIATPSATTIINESTLLVLGPHDNVDRLASLMGGPGPGGHVVLIGAGRVGQEAGKSLNNAGIKPSVIDVLNKPLFFEGNLIAGDATKPHVLHEVQIEKADTLIVTINNDSLNIFIVLASSLLNPDVDVMARSVHVDAVDRLHQAGANHVLSESILGFQLLQIAMVEMGVLPKMKDYVVREINWQREPVTIQELTEMHPGEFKIICVVKNDTAIEPSLDYTLQKEDRIVALGPTGHLDRLA
ncbi:MAG: potassium channel family protein [Bacillota bacterium]